MKLWNLKNLYIGIDPGVNCSWVTVLNDEFAVVQSTWIGSKNFYFRRKENRLAVRDWVPNQVFAFKNLLALLSDFCPKAKFHIAIETPQTNYQRSYVSSMKVVHIYNVLLYVGNQIERVESCVGVNTNVYKRLINQKIFVRTHYRKQIALSWVNSVIGYETDNHNQADSMSISYFIARFKPKLAKTDFFINKISEAQPRENSI